MKKIRFYAALVLMASAMLWACQKEKVQVLSDEHKKTGQTGDTFHIWCATLEEGSVKLEVFHGGIVDNEFAYTWDGVVAIPYPDSCSSYKEIQIVVTSKDTNQDTESLSFKQEVVIKLSDLNINPMDLVGGTYLKITNSSDEGNSIFLFADNGNARNGECLWTSGGGDSDSLRTPRMVNPLKK